MLRGNNTLILNQASMREALQMYVGSLLAADHEVEVVSVKEDKTDHQSQAFVVELKEPEPKMPAAQSLPAETTIR